MHTYLRRGEQPVCDVEASSILPLNPSEPTSVRSSISKMTVPRTPPPFGSLPPSSSVSPSRPRLYHWYSNRSTSSTSPPKRRRRMGKSAFACSPARSRTSSKAVRGLSLPPSFHLSFPSIEPSASLVLYQSHPNLESQVLPFCSSGAGGCDAGNGK